MCWERPTSFAKLSRTSERVLSTCVDRGERSRPLRRWCSERVGTALKMCLPDCVVNDTGGSRDTNVRLFDTHSWCSGHDDRSAHLDRDRGVKVAEQLDNAPTCDVMSAFCVARPGSGFGYVEDGHRLLVGGEALQQLAAVARALEVLRQELMASSICCASARARSPLSM